MESRHWLSDGGDLAAVEAPGAIVGRMQRRKYFVQQVVRVSSSHAVGIVYTEPHKHVGCGRRVQQLQ